uniref:Serrate RNA effector molecule homolog n=1 Tax=Strigamia maritima TaxID=126957 RepID=T1JCQ9_STRMM
MSNLAAQFADKAPAVSIVRPARPRKIDYHQQLASAMGDSDDDYDRRRRDKFRKERSDYQDRRGDDRGRRGGDEWIDSRRDRNRREYRDYDPRKRDRYSPPRHEVSPPMKRMRRDWDDRNNYPTYDMGYGGGGGGGNTGGGAMMATHQNWGPPIDVAPVQHGYGGGPGNIPREQDHGPTQPPIMTFKQFLASQDDTISDEEAVKKYNEYKLEFRRQQLNEFFLSHKEEEWFKSKYHPEECGKRLTDQMSGLKKRLQVFMELMDKNMMDVSIDADKSDEIVKILDAFVIKLEGGNDLDLTILDQSPEEIEKLEKKHQEHQLLEAAFAAAKKEESSKKKEKSKDPSKRSKKKKRHKYDENEESASDSESESDAVPGPENTSRDAFKEDNNSQDATKQKSDDNAKEEGETSDTQLKKPSSPVDESSKEVAIEAPKSNEAPVEPEDNNNLEPRPLHRSCSIFLRNLAPTITKQEVEAMCRRYSGFLRVAIADPQPERRFFRRGWVTFERGVNIKEICWNLNNIRLRDCELGAIVNRDLTRRIRSISGIASHKQVVRADIKLAAKIIQNFDSRHELWTEEKDGQENTIASFGLISKNPLLKNITDYLIEEANAEEEELLGMSGQDEKSKDDQGDTTVERDDALIKVVDRLLLYLRIVHSIDYYNHSDYPNEDEMPNRCGIMHARGPPPNSKVTQQELNEYITTFEQKINPFLQPLTKLNDDEALKLGKKDPEAEVEKFIQANTQELAKDKWLCPLSGKKFKGPEFVRKHIFNKHAEKIEEVEFFNNYLLDPKRPQLPEHPGNKIQGNMGFAGNRGDAYPVQPPNFMPTPQYSYTGYGQQGSRGHMAQSHMGSAGNQSGMYSAGGNYRSNYNESFHRSSGYYQKRGRRQDPREIIGYSDLDAPDDADQF